MSEKIDYVTCSRCGKRVSNKTGKEMIVRAWVECPECLMGATGEEHDLETKKYKIFRWGNYIFNFPMKDEETILETAMRFDSNLEIIPRIPALRPGVILTDDDERKFEIVNMKPVYFPPSRLKGTGRFEPKHGLYSPYGWVIIQYKIKSIP